MALDGDQQAPPPVSAPPAPATSGDTGQDPAGAPDPDTGPDAASGPQDVPVGDDSAPQPQAAQGDTGAVSDADLDISEEDDGSATVSFGKPRVRAAEHPYEGWWENLADHMDDHALGQIAVDLLERVKKDISSRKEREKRYVEGVQRTGIVENAPGGADFEGASRVTHPLLAGVCVDFSARTVKELFPLTGPVKEAVYGTWTTDKQKRAARKAKYFNELFLRKGPEIKSAFEELTTQEPLAGEGYIKVYWSTRRSRPTVDYVPFEDVILPAGVSSFYTSHRVTHRQRITRSETEERIDTGMYRDVQLQSPDTILDESPSESEEKKISGDSAEFAVDEGMDLIYEIYVDYDLDEDDPKGRRDGAVSPYIITVMDKQNTVLAIRRNWLEEDDTARNRLDALAQFGLIPWKNGQYLGIWELAGGLSIAATGALRALLDSALANNNLSALRLEGSRVSGQSIIAKPTQVTPLAGTGAVDDIRKLAMPFPSTRPAPCCSNCCSSCCKRDGASSRPAWTTWRWTPTPTRPWALSYRGSSSPWRSTRRSSAASTMASTAHWTSCTGCAASICPIRRRSRSRATSPSRGRTSRARPTWRPPATRRCSPICSGIPSCRRCAQMATSAPPGMYDLKKVDLRLLLPDARRQPRGVDAGPAAADAETCGVRERDADDGLAGDGVSRSGPPRPPDHAPCFRLEPGAGAAA